MTNEKILKEIDELITKNRIYSQYPKYVATEDFRELLNTTNELLGKIKTIINSEKKDYNKGLNDAWDLARKIGGAVIPNRYSLPTIMAIFDKAYPDDVFDTYSSYQEALAKVEEYEKKKAEEAAMPVRGDIVRFSIGSSVYNAIFLCENQREQCYWVLRENEEFPQRLSKGNFSLIKTGKHVDLDGLFKEINND